MTNHRKGRISLITLWLLVAVAAWYGRNLAPWEENRLINHDVVSYYAWLPAAWIYQDVYFDFVQNLPPDFEGRIWVHPTPAGYHAPKMTMGLALLWTPFFSVAHLVASVGVAPATGYTTPYAVGIFLAALFYLFLGLWFNLMYYVVSEPGMSHVYSFFLFALFLWLVHCWWDRPLAGSLLVGPAGMENQFFPGFNGRFDCACQARQWGYPGGSTSVEYKFLQITEGKIFHTAFALATPAAGCSGCPGGMDSPVAVLEGGGRGMVVLLIRGGKVLLVETPYCKGITELEERMVDLYPPDVACVSGSDPSLQEAERTFYSGGLFSCTAPVCGVQLVVLVVRRQLRKPSHDRDLYPDGIPSGCGAYLGFQAKSSFLPGSTSSRCASTELRCYTGTV